MSEIKKTESNIDNPPETEVPKKPEDHKKSEDFGSKLDNMSSSSGSNPENKQKLENPEDESKKKSSDVQTKKEDEATKLDNLSSTGKASESEKDRLEKADGVREITQPYYDDARELAKKSEMGANFTDHTENHVEQVAEKSLETADSLEKAIEKGKFQVENDDPDHIKFVGNVDKTVLEGAALSHDTGMRGEGYAVKTYEDENGVKRFEKDENGNFKISKEDNENFNEVRSNHSLNSAINVLADREKYKELGYTDDQVDMMAAECMAHSKSSSGVHDLNSRKDWGECFDCMDAVVEQYNKDHPDTKISFDRTQFENDDEKFGQLATSTLALRVGDVSRDSGPDAISQSGDEVHVDRSTLKDEAGTAKGEVQDADIKRGEEDMTNEKSRKIHAGEQNITENHTVCKEDGTVCHEITVSDGDSAPKCTTEAIEDHVKELASAKGGEFEVEVKFDKLPEDKQSYEAFRTEMEGQYDNVQITYPWDDKKKEDS